MKFSQSVVPLSGGMSHNIASWLLIVPHLVECPVTLLPGFSQSVVPHLKECLTLLPGFSHSYLSQINFDSCNCNNFSYEDHSEEEIKEKEKEKEKEKKKEK